MKKRGVAARTLLCARRIVSAIVALVLVGAGATFAPGSSGMAYAAATQHVTWDVQSDFETNASTTGDVTTRSFLRTSWPAGALTLQSPLMAIAAGGNHTVGLYADGTCVAIGDNSYGQCQVAGWTGIVALAAGANHTIGLKADGTCVAVGYDSEDQCDVSDWTGIVAISAGQGHTVGLKSDGTCVATGWDYSGECDVSEWSGIVAIAAGGYHTVGLQADGTCVAAGDNTRGQCEVSGWTDIVAVAAGNFHTVGLASDGTCVGIGYNNYGQCQVSGWADVVAISAGSGGDHTVALTENGSCLATGSDYYGQCQTGAWTDLVAVTGGYAHTIGLEADGTCVAVGYGDYGQSTVAVWSGLLRARLVGTLGGTGASAGLRVDNVATGAVWTSLESVTGALSSGQAVKFAVRTSEDGVHWSAPLGRDGQAVNWTSGTGTYFGRAYGDATARTDLSQIPHSRYIDIVVRLESGGQTTPVLQSVTLAYVGSGLPVAVDDSYRTAEDTPLVVGAPGILANDTDVNRDILTAVRVSNPAHGTLALNATGGFRYTPAAGWSGTDSFTYSANDGTGNSNVATVQITVEAEGVTIEDGAAGVTFDRFVPSRSATYSGGTYIYGRWSGTRIECRFTGTKIAWYGPKQPSYGKADVYIDGVKVATVDCYATAANATAATKIFESPVLSAGTHTISVRLMNQKNAASSGYVVVVDRFSAMGTGAGSTGTRADESVGTFSGAWVTAANSTYTNGTYRYSRWAGAKIRYTFTGTKVAWLGPRTTAYGKADVYIDGVKKATVSQYGVMGWRYRVWESGTLPSGSHTIEIRVLGTKESASSSANIVVDGFDVKP